MHSPGTRSASKSLREAFGVDEGTTGYVCFIRSDLNYFRHKRIKPSVMTIDDGVLPKYGTKRPAFTYVARTFFTSSYTQLRGAFLFRLGHPLRQPPSAASLPHFHRDLAIGRCPI